MIYETSGNYWLAGSSETLQSSLCSGIAGCIFMKFGMGEFYETCKQFKFSLRSDVTC
jgi:hypothetical protein